MKPTLHTYTQIAQTGHPPDHLTLKKQQPTILRHINNHPNQTREHLNNLLTAPYAPVALQTMIDTRLADHLIPEVAALKHTHDPQHRHKNVLAHTLQVLHQTKPDTTIRLAALYHDVGKPATRKYHKNKVTFHGHDIVGAELTHHRLTQLQYPPHIISDVTTLVRMHMRTHSYKHGWNDSAVRRYIKDAGHLLPQLNHLIRCDVTTRHNHRYQNIQNLMNQLEERIHQIQTQQKQQAERPILNGHQIQQHLNTPPGPHIGIILKTLLQHQRDHGTPTEHQAWNIVDETAKQLTYPTHK